MPNPLSLIKLPVFLSFYFIVNVASAQVYNSSISLATGGTGRAAVESGDAALLNPATLVHLPGHYLYSSFSNDEYAFSIGDNSGESLFPAALGYVQKETSQALGDLIQQDLTLSLAEFVADQWAFGITGHYLQQKLPNSSYRQTNADIGLLYTPNSNVGLALVAYNIFGENTEIPENFRVRRSLVAGFNYIYRSTVRLRLDVSTEQVFMSGLETYLNKFMITRIGFQNDNKNSRELLTAGLGFKGPRFAINYGYQGNILISSDYRHSVDLEIPF
jgi:hypothetical protein